MNILILGSGGREHVLAYSYEKNKKVKKVFVAPGNGLTDYKTKKINALPLSSVSDFEEVKALIKKYKIDLVDVANDDLLAEGFVDKLQKLSVLAFGPTKKAAEIEWSKDWSRNFMKKYKLPTPSFASFKDTKKAVSYIKASNQNNFYVKASGLALGKGAIRADSKEEAIKAVDSMKQFGKAGETFLIEESIEGPEFSLFAVCDGKSYKILGAAADHKTVYNNNEGPNTGGMGANSSPKVLTKKILLSIEKNILAPFVKGMAKEGRAYTGIIYLGGMVTNRGVKIIEFNSRWGDPEAEVVLPSIQTDYLDVVEAVLEGRLNKLKVKLDGRIRLSVAGCSKGYPIDYSAVKGKEVFGLMTAAKLPGITIFGAGVKRNGNKFFVNGGRVFHVVAEGKTVQDAQKKAYNAMSKTSIEGNNLHFRTDIGWRETK